VSYYAHSFDAPIEYYDVGSDRYAYTVAWLPDDIAAQLPLAEYPKLRVTGEANDVAFSAALMPVRGRWYILFSKKALKAMDANVGDDVHIAFDIADQDAVDVPEALARAMEEDSELATLWDQQTAGKQRGLAYRVATAKSAETQAKRIAEVRDMMTGKRDARGKLV
jgi:Bacteriocin-protection, YdeI or OmpD-Associated/Domain of unknown function (DUF1905)